MCQSYSHNHSEAKANFVPGNQVIENQWIVDPRATHHVTKEFTNLEENHGSEGIATTDGKRILIAHHGSTKLVASDNAFRLTDTLCAPAMKQNIS